MSAVESHQFVYTFPWAAGGGEAPYHLAQELDTNGALVVVQDGLGVFTPQECRRVIEIGEARVKVRGEVADPANPHRVSDIAAIEPHTDTHWLYQKLAEMFREVNAFYDFELMGFIDAPQYTSYGPGQRYDWHLDVGAKSTPSVRKLSLTVQLSDPSEYAGGELEFLSAMGKPRPKAIGSASFFPAFLPHRVAPVTSGLRRSLVAWACGPSFR